MSEEAVTRERLQELISRGPFNKWLNFTVLKGDQDGVELKAAWREEWVVSFERRYTHGGILAAIVDVAADYAIAAQLGRPVPTIDIRVDYHKAGDAGRPYRDGAGGAHGQPVLDSRGLRLRQGRRAGGQWPRHLFHCPAKVGTA